MIKVPSRGTVEERLRLLEFSVNYSEVDLSWSQGPDLTITTTNTGFVGMAVDRSVFRKLLPNARWLVYAAGFVNPVDANGITVSVLYQKDDATTVTLGSATYTGTGFVKKALGPFDVFGTGGVPAGETIPMVRLFAQKLVSGTGSVANWSLWLRQLANKQ